MSHSPSSSSQTPAARLADYVRGLAELAGVPMDDLLRELAGNNAASDNWLFIPPARAMALMINMAPFIDSKTQWQFRKIKRDANAGRDSTTLRTKERGNVVDVHLIDFFRLVRDIQIDTSGVDGREPVVQHPVTIPLKSAVPVYRCTQCTWTGGPDEEYCPECGSSTERDSVALGASPSNRRKV